MTNMSAAEERYSPSTCMTAGWAQRLLVSITLCFSFTCAVSPESHAEPEHLSIEQSLIEYMWRERTTFSIFDNRYNFSCTVVGEYPTAGYRGGCNNIPTALLFLPRRIRDSETRIFTSPSPAALNVVFAPKSFDAIAARSRNTIQLFDDCSLHELRAGSDLRLVFLQVFEAPTDPQSCIIGGYLAYLGIYVRRHEYRDNLEFWKFALIIATTRRLTMSDAVSEAVEFLEATGTRIEVLN